MDDVADTRSVESVRIGGKAWKYRLVKE